MSKIEEEVKKILLENEEIYQRFSIDNRPCKSIKLQQNIKTKPEYPIKTIYSTFKN